MKYAAYTKARIQAYENLRPYINRWKLKAVDAERINVEFESLTAVDRYAIALHTLDCSPCFYTWYQKELITHLTFPILLHLLCHLDARASSVQEVRLLVEVRGVIKTAYKLLCDWGDTGETELPSELENELAKLWEAYSIANESFLTIADKWFEKYADN